MVEHLEIPDFSELGPEAPSACPGVAEEVRQEEPPTVKVGSKRTQEDLSKTTVEGPAMKKLKTEMDDFAKAKDHEEMLSKDKPLKFDTLRKRYQRLKRE